MKFKNWLITEKYQYLGQCDRLRCHSENLWQTMMEQKQPISAEEFFSMCDLSELRDEDESDEEYINHLTASDPDLGFYKSVWGESPAYFLQTHGFEFIFTP